MCCTAGRKICLGSQPNRDLTFLFWYYIEKRKFVKVIINLFNININYLKLNINIIALAARIFNINHIMGKVSANASTTGRALNKWFDIEVIMFYNSR